MKKALGLMMAGIALICYTKARSKIKNERDFDYRGRRLTFNHKLMSLCLEAHFDPAFLPQPSSQSQQELTRQCG